MRPVKRAQVELRRLTMQSSVALLAELLRRLVAQGAVRPDLVVLTSEPRPLLLGVRRRLEQFPLQKLVPEPAMKRLDVAVLPRTPDRHRDRLSPLLRKPAGQRLADELRTVVASYSGRRPTPTDHPSQHPAHVRPSQRSAYMPRQAFPSVFVHQRQPLACSSRNRAVGDEVVGPDVVLEARRLLDTTVGTRPRFRPKFPQFSQAHGPPQTQLVPQPPYPLEVHRPALFDQPGMDTPIAIARVPARQPPDNAHQGVLVGMLAWLVAKRGTRPPQYRADPPLGDVVGLTQVVRGGPLLGSGHHFFLRLPAAFSCPTAARRRAA